LPCLNLFSHFYHNSVNPFCLRIGHVPSPHVRGDEFRFLGFPNKKFRGGCTEEFLMERIYLCKTYILLKHKWKEIQSSPAKETEGRNLV
jgi:hypothetical protein